MDKRTLTIDRPKLSPKDIDDTYFVDVSSKLYFGKVSQDQYASDINAFYPTGANRDALACIFAQLAN